MFHPMEQLGTDSQQVTTTKNRHVEQTLAPLPQRQERECGPALQHQAN